ncbi:MAG: hypothetical protein MZU97_17905 [Bacillus subtilis]|nr:hypothetical protein [Bacillus subtilis]
MIPYVFATIGYAGTNVFYDSFIVDATTDENMDRVSTTAYAFGYIGGSTLPLIIAIVLLTILPNDTGMLSTLRFGNSLYRHHRLPIDLLDHRVLVASVSRVRSVRTSRKSTASHPNRTR